MFGRSVVVLALVIVLFSAAGQASVSGTIPLRFRFSERSPVTGQVFVGVVVLVDDAARGNLVSARTVCAGGISRVRREPQIPPRNAVVVPTVAAIFPSGTDVPDATVYAWRIPAGNAGKFFYTNCNARFAFADGTGAFLDGAARRWTIRR